MAPVACGNCRAVAPLIARYNDPNLGEAERVLLSTHLLQCGSCLARLQEYRALDQQVRRMSGVTLSPQVREAVLDRVAAPASGIALLGVGLAWRQAWIGAATAISLAAVIFAFGLASYGAAQQSASASPGPSVANEGFTSPLTTSILGSNPTQVVSSVSETLSGTKVVHAMRTGDLSTVRATVREVRAREGRLVVMVEGAQSEEHLVVTGDTLVLWSDGSQGSLADVAAGVTIQVQRSQPTADGMVARQIILTR
jgi:hypothetical protein